MSDVTDSLVDYLLLRRDELKAEIADRGASLAEVERLIAVATDGRHRVAKRRKAGNSTAAPASDEAMAEHAARSATDGPMP
jgi:hypothetical protein